MNDETENTAEAEPVMEGKPDGVRRPMSQAMRTALLLLGAALCLALVAGLGYYQFGRQARGPIDLVKAQRIGATETTVGEGILDSIKNSGIKVVSEGFRPTWGAEQVSEGVWTVTYSFEVGREATWAAWKVDTRSGQVVPRNDLARQIQNGT